MRQYLKISIECNPEIHDLIIAELGLIDFDSFQELDESIEAFIDEKHFKEHELLQILKKYRLDQVVIPEKLENINWNAQWEKNFDPVYIDHKVQIRATFHEKRDAFVHDIIINPKMSFGTGHHETTHLMVLEQLQINHANKRVLDVGTGTGVLAILAYKLGALSVDATDIDAWCIENCNENFELNELKNSNIMQGTIDKLTLEHAYDIILANINKNVLLKELSCYVPLLAKEGKLLLSGFYLTDIDDLKHKAIEYNLKIDHSNTKNDWAMMRLSFANI